MFIRIRQNKRAVPDVLRHRARSLYAGITGLGRRHTRHGRANNYADNADPAYDNAGLFDKEKGAVGGGSLALTAAPAAKPAKARHQSVSDY